MIAKQILPCLACLAVISEALNYDTLFNYMSKHFGNVFISKCLPAFGEAFEYSTAFVDCQHG